MAPAEFFVFNHGVRLACLDYGGSGPPVVLLHGAMRNLGEWEFIAPRLAENYRVVSMDLRGHGASDAVEAFNLGAAVADLEAVISHTDLGNAFVVGHSLGGTIAVLYGSGHGNCPGVVNIDGFPAILAYLSAADVQRVDAFRAWFTSTRGPDYGTEQWLQGFLTAREDGVAANGMHIGLTDPFIRRHYHVEADGLFHRRPSDALMTSVTASLDSLDLLEAYKSLQCRTLVFNCHRVDPAHPIYDVLSRYRVAMRPDLALVETQNPNVRVTDYDSGHMITVDQPEVVIDELMRFMDSAGEHDFDAGLPEP